MTDEALIRYAHGLSAEIEDFIQAGAEAVYSEEEFTRIVLDKLADEGALDNPTLLYQEGTFGRTKYKITGFSIPDLERPRPSCHDSLHRRAAAAAAERR